MKATGKLETLEENVADNSAEINELSNVVELLIDRIVDLEEQMKDVIESGYQDFCFRTLVEDVEELREKFLGEEPRFPPKKNKKGTKKKAIKKKAVKKKATKRREKATGVVPFPVDIIVDGNWECKCYSQDELENELLDIIQDDVFLTWISLYDANKTKLNWMLKSQVEFHF